MRANRSWKLGWIASILLALGSCTALFPASSVAFEELPVGFWQDVSDLAWAIGSDLYGWVAFVVDLAL